MCRFMCAHVPHIFPSKLESQLILTLSQLALHIWAPMVTFSNSPFPRALHREDRPLVQVPKPRGEAWLTPRRRLKGLDHDWIMMDRVTK